MDSHDIETYFRQHRKTLAVLLLATGMLAVSGFFMGMRQTESEVGHGVGTSSESATTPPTGEIPTAPRYKEIPTAKWQANRDWHFSLANLPRAPKAEKPPESLTPDELRAAVARRASLRAYDGAPPVVPHAIDTLSSASCVSCHGEGANLVISGTRPAEISHPWITNCTSCHVPADGLRQFTATATSRLTVDNAFAGKQSAGHGPRAYQGAPPVTPHPVWMRQNCMACHGPGREQAIRSSHPDRANCLQCHAPDSRFDNRESYLTTAPPLARPPSQPAK